MTGRTGLVDLTGCNTGKSYPWPFCAPDGPVTIPDMGWSAFEGLPARDDRYVSYGFAGKDSQDYQSENEHGYLKLLDG